MNCFRLQCFLFLALWIKPSLSQTVAWVNEFHYDDNSTSPRKYVEIAYTGGFINGFSFYYYDGASGNFYDSIVFSIGVPPNYSPFVVNFLVLFSTVIQKGGTDAAPEPDGFALVYPNGTVVEFLSYEGSFTATNGPAAGQTSVDVGVKETGSTPTSHSLQKCPDIANKWIGPVSNKLQQPNRNCITNSPSRSPSRAPSSAPSISPTNIPTTTPTASPSSTPTASPSNTPTASPSITPTASPSTTPTNTPSTNPTNIPTTIPTASPSTSPTETPSTNPTNIPTTTPSFSPSQSPSKDCDIIWTLYNSDTNVRVADLTNGAIVTNPPPCGRNNIEAIVPCGSNKVIFELWRGSRRFRRRRDRCAPYFLFANFGRAIFGGRIPAGRYGIRAIVDGTVSPFTNFTMGGVCF